ncbi:MAG TPA: ABC transporter [Ruminococcaceae bacterium]|nr:ABC transporter [Oscillospiraceae bacterium]
MTAILKRELKAYFSSPIGYIYLATFYLFSGFYFFGSCLIYNYAGLESVFSALFTITIILIPILTMRLLSEDKKHKTDQALLTAPISLMSLVMGKYLAALLVFVMGISITMVFALVLAAFTVPDWAVIFGNFIGLFLMGAALISICMFISALTENQVIAAVGGFAAGFGLILIDALSSLINVEFLRKFVEGMSFMTRYNQFTVGLLDFSSIVFFLSVIAVFVFFTVRVFEKKRWA